MAILLGMTEQAATAASPRRDPEVQVFVLMGQSNMSGRGDVDQLPPEVRIPDPRIMVLGNDSRVRPALEPLDSAINQVDSVSRDTAAGVGPGLSFARELLKLRPGQRLLLVQCAKGGSAMVQWSPAPSRETLYGSCLARTREAGRLGHLAGILWYQGETDAKTVVDASAWAGRFAEMIRSFRSALDDPLLPLMVVGIADRPEQGIYANQFPAWSQVQAAQSQLRLPAQAYVTAARLPRNSDGLHLSTAGQMTLGEMLARRFVEAFPDTRFRKKR